MFTGIIEATANVITSESNRMTIERPPSFTDIRIGSSIAISGVCLTVASLDARSMTFDVVDTTRKKSTLGSLKEGNRVNVERAVSASGRFDGHVVQGHCEGRGEVVSINAGLMTVGFPPELASAIIRHGSVAIDGVSLTVAERDDCTFTVALIPTTLRETTLGSRKPGDRVNIETDLLARVGAEKARFASGFPS